MDLFFNSAGLTIFGIFAGGFVSGVLFFAVARGLISKLIFLAVLTIGGLFLSGNEDVQGWVAEQITGIENAIQGFDSVSNKLPIN